MPTTTRTCESVYVRVVSSGSPSLGCKVSAAKTNFSAHKNGLKKKRTSVHQRDQAMNHGVQ